jgi:hypothetical protein
MMTEAATRAAGIVIRHLGVLYFLPVEVAERVVSRPVISTVPGTLLGMTVVGGRVLPVVDLRRQPGRRPLQIVVCDIDGEQVAIAGISAVASGFFDACEGGVKIGDEFVPTLDVAAEVQRVERQLAGRGASHEEAP